MCAYQVHACVSKKKRKERKKQPKRSETIHRVATFFLWGHPFLRCIPFLLVAGHPSPGTCGSTRDVQQALVSIVGHHAPAGQGKGAGTLVSQGPPRAAQHFRFRGSFSPFLGSQGAPKQPFGQACLPFSFPGAHCGCLSGCGCGVLSGDRGLAHCSFPRHAFTTPFCGHPPPTHPPFWALAPTVPMYNTIPSRTASWVASTVSFLGCPRVEPRVSSVGQFIRLRQR